MSGSRAWFDKDFYSVLGVKEDASAEEIKRAYKKLARQYHPDRNPGDRAAEDRMKDASEAYDVLSDAAKRQEYDQMRQMSRSGYAGGMPGTGWQSNVRYEDIPFDIGDLFGGIFGGGNGRGRRVQYEAPQPEPTYDVQAIARIGYSDAVLGATIRIKTPQHSVKLKVAPGTQPGTVLRARGKGAPKPRGGHGDLLVTIQVEVPKNPSPQERELIEQLAALKRGARVGG